MSNGKAISTRSTTIFEQRDIVVVPFPFVERDVARRRPALIVSVRPIGDAGMLLWAMMITNAAHQHWPGDVLIDNEAEAGLPVPSLVRTSKIATIEAETARRVGRLSDAAWAAVKAELTAILNLV